MDKKYLMLAIIVWGFAATAVSAMDLTESINFASKNNPTVIASQKKADAAKAKLNQAVSAFFPTVNLSGNVDDAYAQPTNVQVTIGGVQQNITIGPDAASTVTGAQASLSQQVFVASLYPEYGIAKKGFESASEDYKQTVIDTSFNVTQTYFGVLKSIKMEKLMSDSLEMAQSHLDQVQSMLNAGMATKADYLRSKVRRANAVVSLTKSGYDIELSKDAFNNALGNGMRKPVNLRDEGFTGRADNLPEYDFLLEAAFKFRPDWKMYLLATGISEEQLRLSKSEYLPSIVLNANAGNQITRYPTYQTNINSWKVTGSGSWKLFDSFGRENRVREAAENLSSQLANVEQIKNDIELEVHDAYLNLKSALDVVVSTKQAVDSAQESFKVSTSRYNSGMGTNTDVLDAQVDLTNAWTDHLQALYDVEIAKAKINKAVGKVVM